MKIKVSDYIIQLLEEKGVDTVFTVAGGAAAHLMESVRTSNLNVVHNYHEQACAMSAEGFARITNRPALVLVTNGPGSSNALTGVLGAWQDSLPMFIISGQVPRHQTMHAEPRKLRQLGLQEADVMSMAAHCTNYETQIHDSNTIKYQVDKAWHLATTGRRGPVWLDIPIDLQAEVIETETQSEFIPKNNTNGGSGQMEEIASVIKQAKRPLIIAGNGIHLDNAETKFLGFVEQMQIPVVCTWNAKDLFNYADSLYVGNFGLLGERAANFAIQNADLLIILGSRLSIPVTGYNSKDFAPDAIKIMVDIDENEIYKHTLKIDYPVVDTVSSFINSLNVNNTPQSQWLKTVQEWKIRYSLFDENHTRSEHHINSFDFMKELSLRLQNNDIVVTDMGTSFTCTMQALRNTGSDRLFTSSGLCSMGFGLPGAIGAQIGSPNSRVICISGDGGFQMNMQEMQTIAQYNLPIKIILLNNAGMLAISLMQDNLFDGAHFGADQNSGYGAPNFSVLSQAYNIPHFELYTLDDVQGHLARLLTAEGPMFIEINMVRDQLLIPRVQSRKDATGKITSGSIDAMFPFLSSEENDRVKNEAKNCK